VAAFLDLESSCGLAFVVAAAFAGAGRAPEEADGFALGGMIYEQEVSLDVSRSG
jgi:hypothetical protein